MTWGRTSTDCPECGCNDTEAVSNYQRFEQSQEVRVCGACSHEFTRMVPENEREDESGNSAAVAPRSKIVVPYYPPPPCPTCGSKDVKITSSPLPTRWHRCRECGQTFSSIEVEHPRSRSDSFSFPKKK